MFTLADITSSIGSGNLFLRKYRQATRLVYQRNMTYVASCTEHMLKMDTPCKVTKYNFSYQALLPNRLYTE